MAALGMVPVHMDAALAALALPDLQVAFGVTPDQLASLLKVQLVCFLLGLLPCGMAVDRNGAMNVFRAGALLSLLSSAAPLLYQSAAAGRPSQVLARWSTWGTLTYAVSPVLGGSLLDAPGWRVVFAIPLLSSALVTVVAMGGNGWPWPM